MLFFFNVSGMAMNMIFRMMISTTLLFLAANSLGAQETQTARITSKEFEPTQVDSIVPELQGIVVLCATQPDSKQFIRHWRDYVGRHHVTEAGLGPLIFQVINEAEAYRGNQRQGRDESPDTSRDRRAKTYRAMHNTAMAIIR